MVPQILVSRRPDYFLLLEEDGIKDYITTIVDIPIDATQLATYKDIAKVRRIILDGVKHHIVPHISELDIVKKK